MSEWNPYKWPDLIRDTWRDWVNKRIRQILKILSMLAPGEVFTLDDYTDDDWPIVGGADDGHSIGWDGGDGRRSDAGGPDPPPIDVRRPWKVITPRVANDIDIQMMATASTYVAGEIHRGVTVPAHFGTPEVGDIGTAWLLEDASVIFLPACRRPKLTAGGTPAVIGNMTEAEAALTDEWDVLAPPAGKNGLQEVIHFRTAYDETSDQKLYAFYRVTSFDEFGTRALTSQETRVEIEGAPAHPASPDVTLGTTAETEAAQTDTWDIGDGSLAYTHQTRTGYAHDGDEKLYAYYRTDTYDAWGRLTKVTVETRVEIDTPEICT